MKITEYKLSKDVDEKIKARVFKAQKVRLYRIKNFIFDFGGVLIEKTFVLKNLFSILEHDLNFKLPDKEIDPYIKKCRRRLSSGRISAREFLEKILEKYYYPIQNKEGALPPKRVNIEYYLELWFNLYTQVTDISSDMAEIVERLHQAGFSVSLMSNTYAIHVKSNRLRGFYDVFDNVFLSNEIGLIKPDIEKYKYILRKLDTKPKNCVFIDDKITNLIPARELGIIVIKFESFEKFKEDLTNLGISKLSPNLRKEIKKKYERYKSKKKEYKKAKKEYKKAKKEYLKKNHSKKKTKKKKKDYQAKLDDYERKKAEYKKEKEKKKDLITEFRIE
ncbi:MAG: HAD family phosphatase [Candidatus Lokiarchaeota archaeon]|nr:HAD family phosphatase [Candidatus Lokiarchaeota archaeon]